MCEREFLKNWSIINRNKSKNQNGFLKWYFFLFTKIQILLKWRVSVADAP